MKILSIRLKNLASLAGEHFIDFEAEPLANAGLVAIVGKTGAGKSTILDAMCLALFNKIPRLKDSDGKLFDIDGSEIATNSPLTILRRGTAHGFAELCFIAQDQKRYLARWEIKRARENANGKLQNVQRSLKCLTDGVVIADKTKAVEQHIQHITQLSFEQFTRAVLLAQSEVTAFLKARDNERGELLEYLTNSAIFAKIGQLAFEKTKEITQQRKLLESHLGHIELLSDDDLKQLHQDIADIQQQHQTLETRKQQLQLQQQWFELKQKLDRDILQKQALHSEQKKTFDGLASERQLLAQLEVFAEIRPQVFQQQQLLNQKTQLEPELQHKQTLFATLALQFEQDQQRYQTAEKAVQQLQQFEQHHHSELNQLRKYIQDRETIAEQYKHSKLKIQQLEIAQQPVLIEQQQVQQQLNNLEQQHKHLDVQLKQSTQFSRLDNGIAAHIQQLSQFIEYYKNIESQIGDIEQAKQQLQQEQKQLNALVQNFGDYTQLQNKIAQQQSMKDQLLNRGHQLKEIQQKLLDYLALTQDIAQKQTQQQHTEENLHALQTQTQALEKVYQETKLEREKLQHVLQQQRLLHAENIEQLRANLIADEPCLVCGSTTHPYRDDENAISKALYALQQQQEQQIIHSEQQHFQNWQRTQQQLTQVQTELKQQKQFLQQASNQLQQQKEVLQHCLRLAEIELDLSLDASRLTANIDENIKQQLQLKIQFEHDLAQQIQAQEQQLKLTQQTQQLAQHLHNLEQRQQQLAHITACLQDDETHAWTSHSFMTAQKILTQLIQRAQHLEQTTAISQQLDRHNQKIKLLNADLQHINQQLTESEQQHQALEQKGRQNSEHAMQLIEQMTGLAGQKANEWLTAHDRERQNLQQQYNQGKTAFEHARQHFEQEKNLLEQLKNRQQDYQSALAKIVSEIETWTAQQTQIESSQYVPLLGVSTQQEQQIRSQLQQAERSLNDTNVSINMLQQQLHEHLKTQPDVDLTGLQQHIHDTQIQWQQCNDQRDQYKIKLELHQQNLSKQQQYADQIQSIQAQEYRWSKISSLIGDAKGKDFRDYAQQYNLDILLEYANQQLATLSQRYTLKRLDNSLSLAIIDHDMDDEIRSVASLSGGESFLTALAISLAIANMASGSMKIESLFIDEGFGTLDASSLHMVMNALDQLQNQGRKVVLISHIQEMHERIPVQIQVQPRGSGSSKIEVVG
ncbi:AAA family ATPase [Acinetobacter sp. MD2(2019)]|uniref:AAA family ATPase n=1 Tax=Acinetobacter sp. MD2(2019) TaxID=2605273 RepID=UPI002D1E599B|nr:AAA family ATPase [Acinetobacter sp. MD2(2019)]MEB3754722.1 AAA family ATPase [Acinetobacter sp. MD2(2019)]